MPFALFANKTKTLKTQKQASDQQTSQVILVIKNMPIAKPSPKPNNGIKSYNKCNKIEKIGNF